MSIQQFGCLEKLSERSEVKSWCASLRKLGAMYVVIFCSGAIRAKGPAGRDTLVPPD